MSRSIMAGRASRQSSHGKNRYQGSNVAPSARAADNASRAEGATFEPWYRFFPWEDWREARPGIIERDIFPELTRWAGQTEQPDTARALSRKDRVRLYFGTEGAHWDEERVL